MLISLYGTAAVIHQLIEEIFRSLSPFLNEHRNGFLLFRGQRHSRTLKHLLCLIAKLIERVSGCGLLLLCDEWCHKEQQQGECAFQGTSRSLNFLIRQVDAASSQNVPFYGTIFFIWNGALFTIPEIIEDQR